MVTLGSHWQLGRVVGDIVLVIGASCRYYNTGNTGLSLVTLISGTCRRYQNTGNNAQRFHPVTLVNLYRFVCHFWTMSKRKTLFFMCSLIGPLFPLMVLMLLRCVYNLVPHPTPSLQTTKGRGRGRATKLGNRASKGSISSSGSTGNLGNGRYCTSSSIYWLC